jgi:hypothetical protein
LPSFRHLSNAHRKDLRTHRPPLLELVQLPIEVKLEVDNLARRQPDHNLTRVRRRANDRIPSADLPLVDTLIGEDVTDTTRVDLEESVVAELLNAESGSRGDEAGVGDLLDGVTNGENESTVDEGEDNIGVVLVCKSKSSVGGRKGVRARKEDAPSDFSFVVQTAIGAPGSSELTASITSSPCLRILTELLAPLPQAV